MTSREISTLVKAGYVIVAAEGQSASNMMKISEIYLSSIPNFDPFDIMSGEEMSMKEMVKNLVKYQESIIRVATILFIKMEREYTNPKALLLLNEIRSIIQTANYSEFNMPELAIRIQVETSLYG